MVEASAMTKTEVANLVRTKKGQISSPVYKGIISIFLVFFMFNDIDIINMNTLFCRGLLLYLFFYVFLIFVIIGYLGYDFFHGLRPLYILGRYFLDILFQ